MLVFNAAVWLDLACFIMKNIDSSADVDLCGNFKNCAVYFS